jgi:hypothetical protein
MNLQSENLLSDIALENVEALAAGEGIYVTSLKNNRLL